MQEMHLKSIRLPTNNASPEAGPLQREYFLLMHVLCLSILLLRLVPPTVHADPSVPVPRGHGHPAKVCPGA